MIIDISTLQNTSQIGLFFQEGVNIKNIWNHQLATVSSSWSYFSTPWKGLSIPPLTPIFCLQNRLEKYSNKDSLWIFHGDLTSVLVWLNVTPYPSILSGFHPILSGFHPILIGFHFLSGFFPWHLERLNHIFFADLMTLWFDTWIPSLRRPFKCDQHQGAPCPRLAEWRHAWLSSEVLSSSPGRFLQDMAHLPWMWKQTQTFLRVQQKQFHPPKFNMPIGSMGRFYIYLYLYSWFSWWIFWKIYHTWILCDIPWKGTISKGQVCFPIIMIQRAELLNFRGGKQIVFPRISWIISSLTNRIPGSQRPLKR